jgi:hypothetical protein
VWKQASRPAPVCIFPGCACPADRQAAAMFHLRNKYCYKERYEDMLMGKKMRLPQSGRRRHILPIIVLEMK